MRSGGRRAVLCGFDDEGRLASITAAPGGHARDDRPEAMTFESGGQGLWSTLDDYLAFARMLIGEAAERSGTSCAAETLGDDDVESAHDGSTRDGASARTANLCCGTWLRHGRRGRHGTGAGGPAALPRRRQAPSDGRVPMAGWWQADPTDRSVLIFLLAHNMLELHQMARGIGLGAWTAIARFHAVVTR